MLGFINVISINKFSDTNFISNISIDTRKIQKGEAFVALRGENYDGHNFIQSAFESGASIAFVEESWFKENSNFDYPLIVVEDTTKVLGEIANFHRQKFEIPIIAIAGSNGKTTTKDFIAHLLSQRYNVLKTESNFNNQIGVPLTLLKLNNLNDIAVIEIGTNKPGEIAYLCDIVEPNHGLITNIGKEHLEFFVDLDGVEQEETTLFGYLLRKDGFVFLNIDDPRLIKYSRILGKFLSYGTNDDAFVKSSISFDDLLYPEIKFLTQGRNFLVKLRTQGISPALCSIPAVAVAIFFELSIDEITAGLDSFELDSSRTYGRMLIKNLNGITIINDTYNANPSSMDLALRTIEMIKTSGRRIGVLGDMKELGDSSLNEHKALIMEASQKLDLVVLFGDEMESAFKQLIFKNENVIFLHKKEDIIRYLNTIVGSGDVILFKASRGVRLEEVVETFIHNI